MRTEATGRQIFGRSGRATTTTCRDPKLLSEVGHCERTTRYCGLDLTLVDCIADTNEHENNYHLERKKNQPLSTAVNP
jgi:hypothetical protein